LHRGKSTTGLGQPSAFRCSRKFPGDREPTILLCAQAEVEQAGFDRPVPVVSVIFSNKLKEAHKQLGGRGVLAGPIQNGGDTQFFEVRDLEGHLIEICQEPKMLARARSSWRKHLMATVDRPGMGFVCSVVS
jgi:hypothetical protein